MIYCSTPVFGMQNLKRNYHEKKKKGFELHMEFIAIL